MISLLIYLALIGIVAWLATYILQQFPPPEPLARLIRVAIVAFAVLAVAYALVAAFGLVPAPFWTSVP